MDFEIANLKDTPESQITETEIYNAIESYLNTNSKVRVSSRLVSTDLELNDNQLVVEATNAVDMAPDLQRAMDTLNERGGGTVYLKAGTYTIKTALTGYSSVSIEGISPSATVLDFVSTAANLSFTGTGVYSTGTITSITSGVNVTGSGTSWLANASAGQYLFIGTRHYKIAAVTSNTTLVLSEGYTDSITMPGAAYRIASSIVDVTLRNFSIKSSTGTGLVFTDAVQITLDNITAVLCNKGMSFTNVSRFNADRLLTASNTSNGYEFTNVGLGDWESVNASANGGHGFVLNNLKTIAALMSSVANTSDGFNFTDCDQLILTLEASSNGGQGAEFVSGCDDNNIGGLFISNTSDGLKLTATDDRNKISGIYKSNGGYGINIAASTCDYNTIDVPVFSGNTSGDYQDLGTNTNIVATVPSGFNYTGRWDDGLTEVATNSTITRDLLTTDSIFSTDSTGWRLTSKTFGQVDNSTDFNWQNADYEFQCRIKSDDGYAWASSTEGRGYLWGLVETGMTTLDQPSNQQTYGRIFDESLVAFYVGGDNKLYAISSTGNVTSGATGLASMDVTDLSAYTYTNFHDYKIVTHYAALAANSDSGFLRPTAHSGGNSNQSNMYDSDTTTAGFAERSGSDGIALSWDGGTTFTPLIQNTINLAKTTVTIGGQYETFGRTWTPANFSNANFVVRLGTWTAGWGNTFSNSIQFSSFGFSTGTWSEVTGIEIELTSETEDEGDGGTAEHKIYDIRVKVYYTTAANTGYNKFYIDNTLVATHTTSIPRGTEKPMLMFAGGPNGANVASGKLILFNDYSLTATIN